MSVRMTQWVWEHSKAEGTALLVLLKIADNADDSGTDAWPSQSHLAAMCRRSERVVQRAIAELVALGELAVMWRAGGGPRRSDHRPNLYRIITSPAAVADTTRTTCHEPPRHDAYDVSRHDVDVVSATSPTRRVRPTDTTCTTDRHDVHDVSRHDVYDRDLITPSCTSITVLEPSAALVPIAGMSGVNGDTPYAADFDECWRAYPRKIERRAALRAYTATRRRGRPPGDLLRATENYARAVTAERRDQSKIKHASTFFGPDEPWTDYVDACVTEPTSKLRRDIEAGFTYRRSNP